MWGIALLLVLAARSAQAACPDQPATVAAHNAARAQYGAGPLTWDADIAAKAQGWADYLASRGCQLQHSHTPGYGENIAATWGGYPAGCAVATQWWVDEAMLYKFTSNPWTTNGPNFESIGHFTQCVWKSTSRLGCGAASGSNGCWVAVCNYQQPGNYATDDEFRANVGPKGGPVLGGGHHGGVQDRSAKPPPPKPKPKSPPPKPVVKPKPKSPPPVRRPAVKHSPPPVRRPAVKHSPPPVRRPAVKRSPPPKPVVHRSPPKYTPRSCSEASWCSWFKGSCNLNVMKQLCPRTCNGCHRRRLIEQPVATTTQPQQLFRRALQQTPITTEPLVVKEVASTATQQEQAKFVLAKPLLQASA